jgi:hypothetical protein
MADKFDLYYQAKETPLGLKIFTTGFDRSVGVRGALKMVLQWLKLFMTKRGSDPTNVAYGTDFVNLIGANIKSKRDLQDVVLLSIQEANKQFTMIQRNGNPDLDETLKSASLVKFDFATTADGFDAYVKFINLAGKEITLKLPDFATRD